MLEKQNDKNDGAYVMQIAPFSLLFALKSGVRWEKFKNLDFIKAGH